MKNKSLDISQILKDCPKGTKLYSPIFGYCRLLCVKSYKSTHPILVETLLRYDEDFIEYEFTKDGKIFDKGECLLFPSKENRDWKSFKI